MNDDFHQVLWGYGKNEDFLLLTNYWECLVFISSDFKLVNLLSHLSPFGSYLAYLSAFSWGTLWPCTQDARKKTLINVHFFAAGSQRFTLEVFQGNIMNFEKIWVFTKKVSKFCYYNTAALKISPRGCKLLQSTILTQNASVD